MRKSTLKRWAVVMAGVLVLLVSLSIVALVQSGGLYDLSWNTIDGGGYTFSTGGSYSLGGTIGQPDAGFHSGGNYTLAGGFWAGGGVGTETGGIYLPIILKNYP